MGFPSILKATTKPLSLCSEHRTDREDIKLTRGLKAGKETDPTDKSKNSPLAGSLPLLMVVVVAGGVLPMGGVFIMLCYGYLESPGQDGHKKQTDFSPVYYYC